MRRQTIATALMVEETKQGIAMTPIEITEVYPEHDLVWYRVGAAHFRTTWLSELLGLRYIMRLPKMRKGKASSGNQLPLT